MSGLLPLVNTLKAAGEVTRLRLLALLATGELSVKDLTEILGQSQPRVSRHLKLLTEAGIVTRNAEGAWAYFALAGNGDANGLVDYILGQLDETDGQIAGDRARLQRLREQQRDQAAAYFSKVADSWDFMRSLHVPDEAVEAAIVEAMGARKVGLLIDLGTGTGRMLELLADHYHQGIGVDSNREMVSIARSKLAQASIGNVHVKLGDISELDDYARAADVITIHQVLHYFDDPGQVLRLARIALKPCGEMIIIDIAPHTNESLRNEHAHRRLGLSQNQMEQWAEAANLSVTAYEELPSADRENGLTVCLWTLRDSTKAAEE